MNIKELLTNEASVIANAGHYGWGNLMQQAAEAIDSAEQRAVEMERLARLEQDRAERLTEENREQAEALMTLRAERDEWKALYEVIDNTAHTNVLRADKAEAERDEERKERESLYPVIDVKNRVNESLRADLLKAEVERDEARRKVTELERKLEAMDKGLDLISQALALNEGDDSWLAKMRKS